MNAIKLFLHKAFMYICAILCVLSSFACGKDLYEVLGVKGSASSSDIRRKYRKLALQYHPDKHPEEKRAEVEAAFVQIANAFRVLSDPARREKYDLYGVVDEGEFRSFEDAFSATSKDVEDTPLNWILLVVLIGTVIVPFFLVSKKKNKSKKQPRKVGKGKLN